MPTIVLTILAAILYGIFGVLLARASLKINSSLVVVISNAIGTVLPLIVYALASAKRQMPMSRDGILLSIIAGVLIAVFSILLTYIFSRAENLSFVMPAIYGGAIVVGVLVGIVFYREQLSMPGIVGVLFIVVGIGLIIWSRLHA
jgi:drug/metabolite transporter (DMT)-like permease